MKRVTLCESAYIDISEEDYNKCYKRNIIDEKTNELLYVVKVISLAKNMILLVPLTEFKDINE